MDYLARESADLSDGLWNRIDETAIGTARAQLTCRRFLKVFGPLGAGVTTVAVDGVNKEEVLEDGIGRIVGRTQLELPLFYEDFTLLSRDMEYAAQTGYPLDPVSYTHLDVYKRQMPGWLPTLIAPTRRSSTETARTATPSDCSLPQWVTT